MLPKNLKSKGWAAFKFLQETGVSENISLFNSFIYYPFLVNMYNSFSNAVANLSSTHCTLSSPT